MCSNASLLNISQFCNPETNNQTAGSSSNVTPSCQPCPTDEDYEYNPLSPLSCFCSLPLHVGYRLKSPGFSDFNPYVQDFEEYLSSGLELLLYQLYIDTFSWEEGPRLGMNLKLFPSNGSRFNSSEVLRIRGMFTGWLIGDSDLYGPYELINFTLGSYASGMS